MKKPALLIAVITLLLTACHEHHPYITIVDNNGKTHKARVAPMMESHLPDSGDMITIMKPLGVGLGGEEFMYNGEYWEQGDNTAIKVVSGRVITIR
jgi:hypothetical protein